MPKTSYVVYCHKLVWWSDTFVFVVVVQCDLLELKEGKWMARKFLQVTRCMSTYCSAGLTSRYHIWIKYEHLFKIANVLVPIFLNLLWKEWHVILFLFFWDHLLL